MIALSSSHFRAYKLFESDGSTTSRRVPPLGVITARTRIDDENESCGENKKENGE
jgi:hypothetical protein